MNDSIGGFQQPFVQTGAGYQFYEPTGGGANANAGVASNVFLDFNDARTFSPSFLDHIAVADTNDVGGWGIQINGSATVGNPTHAVIELVGVVPEPASLALGILGLAGVAHLRRRK